MANNFHFSKLLGIYRQIFAITCKLMIHNNIFPSFLCSPLIFPQNMQANSPLSVGINNALKLLLRLQKSFKSSPKICESTFELWV
ncbi:MAG: hypothetical protein CBC42_05440 [Betaproteobacteria bacterium TMED82]|nr:MAG: hypothetical protein CBC42_05440 [Betaproteobacteria bacterium TMED82]